MARQNFRKKILVEAESLTAHRSMIKKVGSKWYVLSEKNKKNLGSYKTKKEAQKRLKQVEFFKHLKKKR